MRRALILAGFILGVFAQEAAAGTVALEETCPVNCGGGPGKFMVFRAAPGERNDVTVEPAGPGAMRLTERAAGTPLRSGSSECTVEGNVATCRQPETFYVLLYGGDGDDRLSTDAMSGSFVDYLFGEDGDDVLDAGDHDCCVGSELDGGRGDDVLRGGTGVYDQASYHRRTAPVDVSLSPRPAGARNGEEGEADVLAEDMDGMWGGDRDDRLEGDGGPNSIWTGDGVDRVAMGAGDDVLWGTSWEAGEGDAVTAGPGDDHLYPGRHPGALDGGTGKDSVSLSNFGPGYYSQLLLDGRANDGPVMTDGPPHVPIVPDGSLTAIEDVEGNDLADLLVGDAGANEIRGGDGADVIGALAGEDVVFADGYGGGDPDFVHVLDLEEDVVRCDGGLDIVIADPSDRVENCAEVSFDDVPLPELDLPEPALPDPPVDPPPVETPPVGVPGPVDPPRSLPPGALEPRPELPGAPLALARPRPLSPPAVSAPVPAACAVRSLGGAGADCLLGTPRRDLMTGAGGADRLTGRAGADALSGGPGDDQLDGGAGDDRLRGERGNDVVVGGAGRDDLAGGPGKDYLIAADGRADTVRCGSGRDVAVVDRHDRVHGCERIARTRARSKSKR